MAAKIPSAAGSGLLLLTPATWEALRQILEGMDIRPNPEDFEVSTRGGRKTFRLKPPVAGDTRKGGGGGGSAPGAFSRVYTDGDGNTMLQGGTVQGGTGTPEVVDDFQLLASAGTPPADGTHVSISISVTANEDDDVLVPGCEVTSASISEAPPGASSIPTDGSPSGSIDLSLGQWTAGVFQRSGPSGNIIIIHYLGALLIERA